MMQSRALQMETQLSQTKAEVTRIRREKDEVRIAVSVTPPAVFQLGWEKGRVQKKFGTI